MARSDFIFFTSATVGMLEVSTPRLRMASEISSIQVCLFSAELKVVGDKVMPNIVARAMKSPFWAVEASLNRSSTIALQKFEVFADTATPPAIDALSFGGAAVKSGARLNPTFLAGEDWSAQGG